MLLTHLLYNLCIPRADHLVNRVHQIFLLVGQFHHRVHPFCLVVACEFMFNGPFSGFGKLLFVQLFKVRFSIELLHAKWTLTHIIALTVHSDTGLAEVVSTCNRDRFSEHIQTDRTLELLFRQQTSGRRHTETDQNVDLGSSERKQNGMVVFKYGNIMNMHKSGF